MSMLMLALLAQYSVVMLTLDSCTLAQYDSLVAIKKKQTMPGKGKAKAVFLFNYGKLSSEQEKGEKEELVADYFQCVTCNKHLAKKKTDHAKAEQALCYRAENDFSGRIPNTLEVKVWGLLDIEWMNLCFRRALSHYTYYLYYINMMLIGADAN